MRATQFRDKITIKRYTEERTPTGGIKGTLTTLFTDWCKLDPITGRKKLDMGRTSFDKPFDVMMNARKDYRVTNKDIAVVDGEEYQIEDFNYSRDGFYLYLQIGK